MRNCLNILVIAQYFPPDIGGASTRVSNVVKGLLHKGCKIKVVTAFPHYPHGNVPTKYRSKLIVLERFYNAKVLRVWIPSLPHNSIVNRIILHMCFVISALYALLFVGKVDVIWAANPNLFSFFPAILYSFVKRKPIVRNVDDLWPEVFYELGIVRSKLMRKILDFLSWLSYVVPEAITPISAGYKRVIVEKYGVYADKIHVIEVGVERIEPIRLSGDKKDRFVVMYSGVLGLGYDFDIVLEAASLLIKKEDVVFLIRGIGELASKLKRRIDKLNLSNVVLDDSLLPKDKLSVLLYSADVFLLPMTSANFIDEGLPTKVFEYQAYGKPIICVSDGEPARYVEKTKSGIIVKPGDACGLVDAIIRLYEHRQLALKLGRNGRRYVSENLLTEKIGERMYKILASVSLR
jgi:glycosyltransferase involved in cell wall biosynthesis